MIIIYILFLLLVQSSDKKLVTEIHILSKTDFKEITFDSYKNQSINLYIGAIDLVDAEK
jgi:hypothetical protein